MSEELTVDGDIVVGGLLPSPDDPRDWIAEAIFPKDSRPPPAALDLRGDLPPVRSQEGQGTCVAQAAACIKEWQEKKQVDMGEHMSPQFVYNRRGHEARGMWPRDAMQILARAGCCREAKYPYGTLDPSPEMTAAAEEEAQNFRIASYARVETLNGLKEALHRNGPCMITFPVFNHGSTFWMPEEEGQERTGSHAVTVVGYDRDAFLIRNSWGGGWAEKGYTRFPFTQFGMHWELWTSIDAESRKVEPTPVPWWRRVGCCG